MFNYYLDVSNVGTLMHGGYDREEKVGWPHGGGWVQTGLTFPAHTPGPPAMGSTQTGHPLQWPARK